MKRQILLVLMFAIALTVGTAFAYALDDQGNVNDPATNERANACFEDGSMAGECETDWEWTCGWYMIRYENGIFSSSQIPAFCNSLLGTETEEVSVPTPVVDVCAGPVFGFAYVHFGAANFLASPVQFYSDSACTITYFPGPISVAYAPSLAEASTICAANVPGSVAALLASDVYECELVP